MYTRDAERDDARRTDGRSAFLCIFNLNMQIKMYYAPLIRTYIVYTYRRSLLCCTFYARFMAQCVFVCMYCVHSMCGQLSCKTYECAFSAQRDIKTHLDRLSFTVNPNSISGLCLCEKRACDHWQSQSVLVF